MAKKRKRKQGKITKALNNSPINYFSDLFIIAMVLAWIIAIIVMMVMAVYATVTFCDTSIWCYVQELVAVPLAAGSSVYLVKCGVQHAIANNQGKQAHMDFPRVDTDEFVSEEMMFANNTNPIDDDDETPLDDEIDKEAVG